MDSRTYYILNDLHDAIDKLAELVRELNPGATNQHKFIELLLTRSEQALDRAAKAHEQS